MLLNTLFLALRSIRRNLLRSFLTILGIVIGVSAVITMVTLGNGATQAVQMQISSLGTNLLMVRPGQRQGPGGGGGGGAPAFKEADAEAILAQIGGVAAVAPEARASVTVVGNGRNWATSVTGSTNAWFDDRQLEARLRPRAFEDDEQTRRRRRVHHRRDGAARDLRRHARPGRAAAHQAVLVRGDRRARLQGPGGDGQRPGRHGAGAAAHAAAPRHRQPARQHAAGVDGGRQRQHAAQGQPAPAAARAPQARRRRRRQLQRPRHPATRRDAVRHDAGDDHAARRRGRGEPAGGRHRHHEHHAGQRDRAHPRDRPAPGHRRARARGAAAVPDRGGGAGGAGRPRRHRHRHRARPSCWPA